MDIVDEIPGLRQAIEAETEAREAAFLPFPEFVCGFPVLPLSVRHVAILTQLKLPFLDDDSETELSLENVELFLWILSPTFTTRQAFTRGFRRWRHALRFFVESRRQGQERVASAVGEYVASAFADAPGGNGSRRVNYTSWIAKFIDLFGSEYGWGIDSVLDLPLKVAFQLERQITLRYDSGAILFNPSDAVRSDFLRARNAERKNN